MKQTFKVNGMSCVACASKVEAAAAGVAGVERACVNLLTNTLSVELASDVSDTAVYQIEDAVSKSGYQATSIEDDSLPQTPDQTTHLLEQKHRLIKTVIATVVMCIFAMGYMLGFPVITSLINSPFRVLVLSIFEAVMLAYIMLLNKEIFRRGVSSLIKGTPTMDALISLSCAASAIYSLYCTALLTVGITGSHPINMHGAMDIMHHITFDSAAMIICFVTCGKYLEARAKGHTTDALGRLMDLSPKTAVVVRDGKRFTIPSEQLQVGDICDIAAGSTLPCDGVVVQGEGSVEQSALTGESQPLYKTAGDAVVGGTSLVSGWLQMRATEVGSDTQLAAIIRLVDEATTSKAPIERIADKVAAIFVPCVIVIAALTLGAWWILGSEFSRALDHAIVVLVVSCPCALGLAVPTALMVGTGRAAELGFLIKNGEALEEACKTDVVVFDKTGTLTKGAPQVQDVIFANDIDEMRVLGIVATLESKSNHPLSQALLSYVSKHKHLDVLIEDFSAIEGQGLMGLVGKTSYYIGNERLLEAHNIKPLPYTSNHAQTLLYCADDTRCLAVFAVADEIRPESYTAISELHRRGIKTVLLSGDSEEVAQDVAHQLDIDEVYSQVLPAQKEEHIRKLQARGLHVAMVGDGINDAPALVRANTGIAIGAGTDVALDAADIVLMHSDPADVARVLAFSSDVLINIKQNLFWALIYNVLCIPIATGLPYALGIPVELNVMVGAAAMSLSSVFVVLNALRLAHWKPYEQKISVSIEDSNLQPSSIERNSMTLQLKVPSMACAMCQKHVTEAVSAVSGVLECQVDLDTKIVSVTCDDTCDPEELLHACELAGYPAQLI